MATIIRVTGEEEEVSLGADSLVDLQKIVGGFIEIVYLPDKRIMVIDEDGKLKGKPINKKAPEMYAPQWDTIVGDVVVCTKQEFEV